MTPALSAILSDLDIRVVPVTKQRGLMETHAVNTMERILATRPPNGKPEDRAAHLRSVLMSIVETENNKRMLVAPVIYGLSDILIAHPSWFGGDFLDAMDKIDLAEMQHMAKSNKKAVPARRAIATMLFDELRKTFQPTEQGRLL